MKTRLVHLLAILIVCTIPCAKVAAQFTDFQYNRFTINDGLASNTIYSICQDRKGFIWIGTPNGLQRYDGHHFYGISMRGPVDFRREAVTMLVADQRGRVWTWAGRHFGYFDPVFFVYHETPLPPGQENTLENRFYIDSKGRLFLLALRQNVFLFDEVSQEWKVYAPMALPEESGVSVMFEDVRDNLLWLGTMDGLRVYEAGTHSDLSSSYAEHPLVTRAAGSAVEGFHRDTRGRYWCILRREYDHEVIGFDPATGSFLPVDMTSGIHESFLALNGMVEDVKGTLWFYGMNGLLTYEEETGVLRNHRTDWKYEFGFKFGRVMQISTDRENSLWVATDKGLYHVPRDIPGVRNLVLPTDDGDNNITGICQSKNGRIWISTWAKGILLFDEELQPLDFSPAIQGLSPEVRQGMSLLFGVEYLPTRNEVVVSGQGGMLVFIHAETLRTRVEWPEAAGGEGIVALAVDKDVLWMGTMNGKVIQCAWKEDGKAEYTLVRQLDQDLIGRIRIDRNGDIWTCALDNGLKRLRQGDWEVIARYDRSSPLALNSDMISDFAQLNDSVYYIAAGTLYELNTSSNTLRNYTYVDGLTTNEVGSVYTDAMGQVWVCTTDGICRLNPQTGKFVRYDWRDGFVFVESLGDVGIVMQNGDYAWAGSNQVAIFDPKDFTHAQQAHTVTLTDVQVMGRFLPVDSLFAIGTPEWSYWQNDIRISFASLSYLDEKKLNYFYRLVGAEEEWISAGPQRTIAYGKIAPGEYTFEVKCVTGEGLESEVTRLSFCISAPFWQQWWFYLLVFLFVGGILYLIYRMRINRILAVEAVRSRVARDLHDDVGSTLSTINILSAMAKSKLQTDPPRASEFLSKITDNSQRMMEVMDDIVWSIKPDNDNMQRLLARMREFASHILEPKDIEPVFMVEEEVQHLKLDMEQRRDFFLVFKEAVNNAAKYSHADKVEIRIRRVNHALRLEVSDNGGGFDPSKADSGNGLSNMAKRSEKLRGSFSILSTPGAGTTVNLEFPV